MKGLHFLPILILFITITPPHLTTASPPSSSSSAPAPMKNLSNDTIYRISKQLCWNCLGEALQFLFRHNLVRASKWEPPLAWDPQLETYARWWAGQRKADCRPMHSFPEGDFKLGENIYWGSGSTWTPGDAVKAWADEEKYDNYAANSCAEGQVCGHYTQIVWRKSLRVGCARVVCDDGDVFMTCNYYPPGNYIGIGNCDGAVEERGYIYISSEDQWTYEWTIGVGTLRSCWVVKSCGR